MPLMRTPNLRFGWLEAFVAVDRHLSYELARTQVGLHATSVRMALLKLELWLRHVLVFDDCLPLEMAPAGTDFLPKAVEILELVDSITRPYAISFDQKKPLSLRKTRRSAIKLSDLKSLKAVVHACSYKNAAADSGIIREVLQRDVKALESALGGKLIEGRVKLHVTEHGALAAKVFSKIEDILYSSQSQLIDGHDFAKEKLERAYNVYRSHVALNRVHIGRAERASLTPAQVEKVVKAKADVAIQQQLIDYIEEQYGFHVAFYPKLVQVT